LRAQAAPAGHEHEASAGAAKALAARLGDTLLLSDNSDAFTSALFVGI
jgi:hypothetical protein